MRLHASRRRNALPRQRTVGSWQQAASRQFRHLLFILGDLLLTAARNVAGWPRLIGKDVANLRARGRRKRDRRSGDKGRKTGQDYGSKHLAALTGESGLRYCTGYRRSQVFGLTRRIRRGKGGLPPPPVANIPILSALAVQFYRYWSARAADEIVGSQGFALQTRAAYENPQRSG